MFDSEAKEPDYVDTYGDLVTFVRSMMDMLDEGTDDIYAFLASLLIPALQRPLSVADLQCSNTMEYARMPSHGYFLQPRSRPIQLSTCTDVTNLSEQGMSTCLS